MKIMKAINRIIRYPLHIILAGVFVLIFTLSCERPEEDLRPATFPSTAEVFIDGFSAGLEFNAFGDSKVTAFTVDEDVSFENVIGTSSMRFDIPNEGDPEGPYAGGIFRDLGGRDLSGYNALTFYAKASKAATVDLMGFGADFMGDQYATTASIRVGTSWTKYILPLPDPAKLTQLKGLFSISEGPEDGDGYTLWVDVVKYEALGTLAHPRPAIFNGQDVGTKTYIGLTSTITGLTQTVNLPNGGDQTVNATPSYFDFTSSDTTVAKVNELGVVSVVGEGTAKITAVLAGEDCAGSLTVESQGEFTHAPVPDRDAANVISVFSDAYTNIPVDFYNGFFAPFQRTLGGADLVIDDDNIIKYTQLNFVATEFKNPTVNASEMTHFHVDIQIENPIEAEDFITIQLGDFGPDGVFGTDDDSSGEVRFDTSPPLVTGEWISLDIPLADFVGLSGRTNLAQIFFISDGSVPDLPGTITDILVDNMYFYKDEVVGGPPVPPTAPAADPTEPATNVISIYSDSYTDIPNEGFNLYGAAAFEEVDFAGNKSLKYTFVPGENGNFQVIELGGGNQIDAAAAGMTNFRFDLWFPNAVGPSSAFLMKVVDIPGSGPTEGSINISTTSTPAMDQGMWLNYDIPLTELESNGLGGKSNIQQVVIDLLSSGEVYVDNIYFYKSSSGATEPTTAAPTPPARDAANVISIFSDAYANIMDINLNPDWGQSTQVSEVDIEGNNTLKYADFNYQGTDFSGNAQDVTGMEFLHVDMWTADATDVKVTPINNSGDPKESLKGLTPITAGQWVSYDIALADFTASGMTINEVIQLKFDGQAGVTPSNIWLDNLYFYRGGGSSGPSAPTDAPAAPPARDAADVISIYGEAYGTAVGLNNVPWDGATEFTEENIASNNVLKVEFDDFLGSDLGSVVDASSMTHFHMDFWISDDFQAGQIFNPKWSNHAGGAGESSSFELTRAIGADDVQKWVSIDVPITDFTTGDNTQKGELAQYLISVANTIDVAYVDNIYFYKDGGGSGPSAPTDAPAAPPARDATDVVSIYGEAYGTAIGLNNVPWDGATEFTEENIANNNVLKIDFDGFLGSDLGSVADATDMTHFHMDFWISDDFAAGQIFNPKWSNHAGGAGETSSFELTRAIGGDDVQKWVSIDVPITDFTTGDNTQRAELAQFLISVASTIDIAYVDNIYFYKDSGGGGTPGPTAPTDAPTAPPARDVADVISIYGEAYGTAVGLSNVPWDDPSAFTEENIANNNVLKVELGGGFLGTDLGSVVDASAMTHFHMDFWISDDFTAGQVFNPKWSNHAGGAGETSAFELTRAIGGDDVQKWISIDVPITDFTTGDNTLRAELAQFLISVASTIDVAYIDNIYFYK